MQISSANVGSYFSSGSPVHSGIDPAALPAARKPDVGASSNANIAVVTTSVATSDARTLQRIAPLGIPTNSEASRALVLARQREGLGVLAGIVQISQPGNEVAVQRAVAEYSTVAAQEQRYGMGDALAGIDVFA